MARVASVLRLYYFAAFASIGIIVPFLPAWLEARGLRGLEMSTLIAIRPAIGVVAPVVFGVMADALGLRGSLVRLASGACALIFAVLTVGSVLDATLGFWGLLIPLALFAFFRPPMTTIADVATLEGQQNYGKIRLWGSIGFAITVLCAGRYLDVGSSVQLPLAITVALLAAFAMSFALPRTTTTAVRPSPEEARLLLRAPDFRWLLVATFMWQIAHASYDLCVSLHLRDLGADGTYIGLSWAVGTIAEVALMAWSEKLLARFGAIRLMALAFAIGSARWVLLSQLRSLDVLLLIQPLHAVSFALVWVSSMSYLKRRSPPQLLATAQGVYSAAFGCGAAIGLLVWGPVYQRLGGSAVFLVAAAVAALGAFSILGARTALPRRAVAQ